MANTKFTRAVKKAKQMYRAHPQRYGSFSNAVKIAYKHVGGAKPKKASPVKHKKKAARKKPVRRVAAVNPTATKISGVSTASLKGELRTRLRDRLGKQLVRREMATTKREKRRIGKEITFTKRELKKI